MAEDRDDGAKAVIADEQVANKMQRLNLFFEKENVKTPFILICSNFAPIFVCISTKFGMIILFLLFSRK